jgi:hypothetical protein
VPEFIGNDKKQCLFDFLKLKIQEQNISDLDNNIVSGYKKCAHTNKNLDVITNFDGLLINKINECDNIRECKNPIGNELLYYQFEWIFNVHSFLEQI